jgi:autotransporter-associated beta strand protein
VGNQFNFDVYTTFDGGYGAVDALDSGAAATSESSSTYVNPYSSPPTPYDSATAPGSTYATTIYNVVTPTFTWNDGTAAAGYYDGTTWDVNDNTKYNWNNGIFADYYTDNINVVFNDNNNGNYAVSLNTIVNPASVLVNNSAGNYTISGTGTIGGTGSLTKSGTSTLTLSTANTYSGGTNVTAGLLLIQRTSSTTSALPKGALSISGGELQLASNVTQGSQSANVPSTAPASNVNITSLAISGTGEMDITNNHLIVDYTSGHDPIGSIATWIADGAYGAGTTVTWTGTGITSSAAAANPSYGIGYADAADAGNPAGLAAGQIEIMYTLLGDANLDGKVNGTDFNLMATNFNQAVTAGWDKGDFNYDGKVNGNDFVLLAANFNQFASQSAVSSADAEALDAFAAANGISLTSVPEPASVGLLLAGVTGLMARRRRSANS